MINNGYDATLSAQLGGFDPLMLMGLSTLGMMGVGWLIGPVFGNMVFNLAYRGVVSEFTRVSSLFSFSPRKVNQTLMLGDSSYKFLNVIVIVYFANMILSSSSGK